MLELHTPNHGQIRWMNDALAQTGDNFTRVVLIDLSYIISRTILVQHKRLWTEGILSSEAIFV